MTTDALRLKHANFKQQEYAHTTYAATLSADVTLEDALQDSFWINVAVLLKVGDLIEVRRETNDMFAVLYVYDVAKKEGAELPTWAKVHVVSKTFFGNAKDTNSRLDYTIQHKGPSAKFCVTRTIDQTVVFKEGATKEAAQKWLDDNFPK